MMCPLQRTQSAWGQELNELDACSGQARIPTAWSPAPLQERPQACSRAPPGGACTKGGAGWLTGCSGAASPRCLRSPSWRLDRSGRSGRGRHRTSRRCRGQPSSCLHRDCHRCRRCRRCHAAQPAHAARWRAAAGPQHQGAGLGDRAARVPGRTAAPGLGASGLVQAVAAVAAGRPARCPAPSGDSSRPPQAV